jgi:hypothetical protein
MFGICYNEDSSRANSTTHLSVRTYLSANNHSARKPLWTRHEKQHEIEQRMALLVF